MTGHPRAVVPAATCARQLPQQELGRGRGGDVVHALVDERPLCKVRVRHLDTWDGAPLRLCSMCADALAGARRGRFWAPTRVELGDMHLHAALAVVAECRARLAAVRLESIGDGSALAAAEALPLYRVTRGIPDSQPVPPAHTALILGQVLADAAPQPPVLSPAETAAQEDRAARLEAEQRRFTDRIATSSASRRGDLYAAKAARRAAR